MLVVHCTNYDHSYINIPIKQQMLQFQLTSNIILECNQIVIDGHNVKYDFNGLTVPSNCSSFQGSQEEALPADYLPEYCINNPQLGFTNDLKTSRKIFDLHIFQS